MSFTSVVLCLALGSLASGSGTDQISNFCLAVAHQKHSNLARALARQEETIFIDRMLLIKEPHRKTVVEDALAVSKVTLCFLAFAVAFAGSDSNLD